MNRLSAFRNIAVIVACCLASASCTDGMDDGNRLPDGSYPMTFTAAVDGQTATRATTDNSWAGNEAVAIQIGSDTKEYTVASNGSLSVASGGTPFYWQSTADITVNAWYPYHNGTKPDVVVKANQSQAADYQASDYLEAVNATVTFRKPELTFTHRTAKVVVTLQAGDGITDVSNATVTFMNQTGVENNGNTVTPKVETNTNATTYTALLVPKQMQNQKFIKVTLGGYDYFYTPANVDDANLTAGKKHIYTVTVNKSGLNVKPQTSTQWTGTSDSVTGNAQTVKPGTDGNGSSWTQDGSAETVMGTEKTTN